MREYNGMYCARWSTLTESIWKNPSLAMVAFRCRLVTAAGRARVKPCAPSAMRRACSGLSEITSPAWRVAPTDASALVVEQVAAHGEHGGLHARLHLQLLQHVADVVLDRVLADEQLFGDLAVALAVGDLPQNLQLAGGERRGRAGALGHADELVEQLGGHARADQRLTTRDEPDRLGDLVVRRAVLEQVARGTALDRLVEVGLLVTGGEHDDAGGRRDLLDRRAHVDTAAPG